MAPNPFRRGIDALQALQQQTAETVTRTARIDISGSSVDEIDPPDDIDELWNQYKTTGIVRANLNQFVSDVVEPGVRVEADDDTTEDFFNGGDAAPEDTPSGGFLDNAFVFAGERHQPFLTGLKSTILNRWIRGTVLVELLKADRNDATSMISGFYMILPETVYPQVEANRNILLPPDPDDFPGDLDETDIEMTQRGEVAAYIQFDDQSIVGRRGRAFKNKDTVPLSQNDVMKQTLDPDIGGADMDEQGVFGTSILRAVTTDIEEYKATKRDKYTAIQTKAYGIWLAQFNQEVYEVGENEFEVVEWPKEDQNAWIDEVGSLKPGEIVSADGEIELEKFEGEVPDLDSTLDHYVDDITAPLPAPKYSVGFEKNINQFVSNQQEQRYERLIDEERRYQERKWLGPFRMIAERHDALDPSGLKVLIEPEEDDSPIRSLDAEEIDMIKSYAQALDLLSGPGSSPTALVDDDALRELIAQLPDDVAPPEPEPGQDGDDGQPMPPGVDGEDDDSDDDVDELDEDDPEVLSYFETVFGAEPDR